MPISFKNTIKNKKALSIVTWIIAIAILVILVIGAISFLKKQGTAVVTDLGNYFTKASDQQAATNQQYANAVQDVNTYGVNQHKPPTSVSQKGVVQEIQKIIDNPQLGQQEKAEALRMKAELLVAQNEFAQAIQAYEAILSLTGYRDLPTVKFALLQLYLYTNHPKTESLAADIVTLYPNTDQATAAAFVLGKILVSKNTPETDNQAEKYLTQYVTTLTTKAAELQASAIGQFIKENPLEEALFQSAILFERRDMHIEARAIYQQLSVLLADADFIKKGVGAKATVAFIANTRKNQQLQLDQDQGEQLDQNQDQLEQLSKAVNSFFYLFEKNNYNNNAVLFNEHVLYLTQARFLLADIHQESHVFEAAATQYLDIIHNTPLLTGNSASVQSIHIGYDASSFAQSSAAKLAALQLLELYKSQDALNNKAAAGKLFKQIQQQYNGDQQLQQQAAKIMNE